MGGGQIPLYTPLALLPTSVPLIQPASTCNHGTSWGVQFAVRPVLGSSSRGSSAGGSAYDRMLGGLRTLLSARHSVGLPSACRQMMTYPAPPVSRTRHRSGPVLLLCLLFLLVLPSSLTPQSVDLAKLDPTLRGLLRIREQKPDRGREPRRLAALQEAFSAGLVRTEGPTGSAVRVLIVGDVLPGDLQDLGVVVTSRLGEVTSAWAPLETLPRLTQLSGVRFVEASRPLRPAALDVSVPEVRGSLVRNLTGLKGNGVLIGLIDTGIDWAHPDFVRPDGTTRIKWLWDKTDPTGPPPPELAASGGTLYTEAQINSALAEGTGVNEIDSNGHGTAVAGTAAGDGSGTNGTIPSGTFVGMAPEAELIVVKSVGLGTSTIFQSADVVDGLAFIDARAGSLGRPYVVNMSLIGHLGAHDGTAAHELAIDETVGPGIPGKAVVVAAGNDGDKKKHALIQLGSSPTIRRVRVLPFLPAPEAGDDELLVEAWYPGNQTASVRVITPSGLSVGPVPAGSLLEEETQDGAISVDNASGGLNPVNGDRNLFIKVVDFDDAQGARVDLARGTWQIEATGSGGTLHMWLPLTELGGEFFGPDAEGTTVVNMPGTARNAVTVGSYVTKASWTDIAGGQEGTGKTIGEISDFSSPGPTRDGRRKPELAAPGDVIATSLSADAATVTALKLQDGHHTIRDGTSFATPHVAGAAALLIEFDPILDATQLRNQLTQGALSDEFTGSTPNDVWGFGKLDAFSAIRIGLVIGDANQDGRVDVGDLVTIVNFILGRVEFTVTQKLVAEKQVDGEINIADVVALINQILGLTPSVVASDKGIVPSGRADVSLLTGESAGQTVSVVLSLNSAVPVAGLQVELEYDPARLQLGQPEAVGRGSGLTLDYHDDGRKLLILAYAARSGGIPGGDGPVIRIPVLLSSEGEELSATSPTLGRVLVVDPQGGVLETGGRVEFLSVSAGAVQISSNRPNPLTPQTGTRFSVNIVEPPSSGIGPLTASLVQGTLPVSINIYNVRGQLIRRLFNDSLPPGEHSFEWDARGERGGIVSAGLYFCQVVAGSTRETLRMIVVHQ